jgi:hypothetical protein
VAGGIVHLDFLQSPTERATDENRQLELLGQVIKITLKDTLIESLPHEIAFLLDLLELKERRKEVKYRIRD